MKIGKGMLLEPP